MQREALGLAKRVQIQALLGAEFGAEQLGSLLEISFGTLLGAELGAVSTSNPSAALRSDLGADSSCA